MRDCAKDVASIAMRECALDTKDVATIACETDDQCDDYTAPPIEQSVDMAGPFRSVMERYYTSLYLVDFRGRRHDYRLLVHSNGLVLVLLAPSHYVVRQAARITGVDFQVTGNTNRLANCVSGKRKHGAQRMNAESPLLRVLLTGRASSADSSPCPQQPVHLSTLSPSGCTQAPSGARPVEQEEVMVVPACVGGKLIELNGRLAACPGLMVRGLADGSGYLAVIKATPHSAVHRLRSMALTGQTACVDCVATLAGTIKSNNNNDNNIKHYPSPRKCRLKHGFVL